MALYLKIFVLSYSIIVPNVKFLSQCARFFRIPLPLVWLTLKVLVVTIDARWEGMGDVGSVRYEPALFPPCPTIRVLSYTSKFSEMRHCKG